MMIFSVKCLILHLFLDAITAERKFMNMYMYNHAQIKISDINLVLYLIIPI